MSIKGSGARQMRNLRKEWEFQVRFDKLLERAGDAPHQLESRRLMACLLNDEPLTRGQLWQLRDDLMRELPATVRSADDGEGAWGSEGWARVTETLDRVEQKLEFGNWEVK